MSSYRENLARGRQRLLDGGIEEGELDAWYLLEECSGYSRAAYFLHCEEQMPEEQETQYIQWIERRLSHEPLQHILQKAWFMGLEFFVNGDVLVPRQDTELLVEEAGKVLRPGMQVLDLCTGSGCILLSLLSQNREIQGVGVDISPAALAVARENEKRLRAQGVIQAEQAAFLESDLWEQVTGTYDILVSNPPYIPTDVIEGLMPEVRDFDPILALDGEADGLAFYRRIIERAADFLKPGGALFLEIGYDQGEAVLSLLEKHLFIERRIYKDLAGNDRVAAACRL